MPKGIGEYERTSWLEQVCMNPTAPNCRVCVFYDNKYCLPHERVAITTIRESESDMERGRR